MNTTSITALNHFISSHSLKTEGSILLFDATIIFFRHGITHINSQVQVISLPDSMVVYIFEFLKPEYAMTEMYSTVYYRFITDSTGTLKVIDSNGNNSFVMTITPL